MKVLIQTAPLGGLISPRKLIYAGLYSKHVPIVPVLVESWSGLVNLGSWWPEWASYKEHK